VVEGLDIFRERFRAFRESFVLIGGAACDDWFTSQGLSFRATKDLDIVLIIEKLDANLVSAFRSFIDDGGYEIHQRTDETPILYRFAKPKNPEYPFMLELFSRDQGLLELAPEQTAIPINTDEENHSLSAILLDDNYYTLLREHQTVSNGLPFANATSLIPLKAKAWLDLSERLNHGEQVDSKDINKHRSDVFRLAATLPGEPGPSLPTDILADLQEFLDHFSPESGEWQAILAALKPTLGTLKPVSLIEAITAYFQLKL